MALSSVCSLFQTQGPAAEKARSPSLSLIGYLTRSLLLAEHAEFQKKILKISFSSSPHVLRKTWKQEIRLPRMHTAVTSSFSLAPAKEWQTLADTDNSFIVFAMQLLTLDRQRNITKYWKSDTSDWCSYIVVARAVLLCSGLWNMCLCHASDKRLAFYSLLNPCSLCSRRSEIFLDDDDDGNQA